MKVRSSVRKMCDKCQIIIRRRVRGVRCKVKRRHNQRQG